MITKRKAKYVIHNPTYSEADFHINLTNYPWILECAYTKARTGWGSSVKTSSLIETLCKDTPNKQIKDTVNPNIIYRLVWYK